MQYKHSMMKWKKTLDKIAPIEEKKEPKRQNKPWYMGQLLEERKTVRNQERAYLEYREGQHWKAFTREQNRYNKMLEYNKRHHLATIVKEANKDSKQLFKALDSILGNKNENQLPTGTTDSELAEDFADFFLNKMDRIRKELTNIPAYQPNEIDTPKLRNFTPITQSHLEKTIKAMPTNSCQLDVIPTDKVKKVLGGCLPALTHIINKSLETNQFCSEWKEALVKLLIKKTTAGQEKSNYRPVSNLSFISKIVENVILIQFAKHCDENKLLPAYQSAYRKNHSCKTSLLKVVDDLLWAMEEQLVTAVVILDLLAAFDTVGHDLLLEVWRRDLESPIIQNNGTVDT